MSGIFGVVSKGDCIDILFYGTDYLSHLGTEFGGIAVLGKEFRREIHSIAQSQFKSKFYEHYRDHLEGNKGIGVVTSGDEQPIYMLSRFGAFCLVTTGFIENADELAARLLAKGFTFSEVSKRSVNQTELAAKLITQGEDIVDGIKQLFDVIEGSCSLLLLHKDGIYAARDRLGYSPLTIGQRSDALAVTSESCSFPNNRFETLKNLEPGEIVLLNEKGIAKQAPAQPKKQICSFLWIYTGFPASTYENINVEIVRERSGRALARRDKDIEVDIVSGVPDSGIAHAIGYAMESGKPYRRPLVKYTPGYGRSYTPPSQVTRDLVATMKLIPVKEIIEGNRIVVCEDSIVRGTQLKNFTVKKLWEAGAKEIHARAACPPLMFPCKFYLSTRTNSELAARRAIRSVEGREPEDVSPYLDHTSDNYREMVEWIRKDLEVTTLRYQTIDDMIQAIGLPREDLCLHCWNGQCPNRCSQREG